MLVGTAGSPPDQRNIDNVASGPAHNGLAGVSFGSKGRPRRRLCERSAKGQRRTSSQPWGAVHVCHKWLVRHCERSEAIRIRRKGRIYCFHLRSLRFGGQVVGSAPRNDEGGSGGLSALRLINPVYSRKLRLRSARRFTTRECNGYLYARTANRALVYKGRKPMTATRDITV